ncbi:uncharacterized protein LOC143548305 [Bidens hawaiensis]|uniref:uncharacterized protein LOC143548305 n=1 Tax=Bidens hawaiensis TaxID=980011 RepID=UPI00404A2592
MDSFMDAQGIWDAIEPPEGVDVDVKVRKKARAFIFQALPEDILLQVACHKETKEAWNCNIPTSRADNIDNYASKIGGIVSKFQTLGTTIEEKVLVKKLLTSAPTRFLPIVATIEHYSVLKTMPFEEIVGCLKAYEERIKPVGAAKDSSGQLLLIRSEWQEKHRSEAKQVRKGRGSAPINHRGLGKDAVDLAVMDEEVDTSRIIIKCKNRFGHFVADFRATRRTEGEANLVRVDDDTTLLMVKSTQDLVMLNEEKVFPSEYVKDSTEKGTWYLDNGASNHMTGERIYFSELDEKTIGRVKFGDGSSVEIRDKGSILLQCKNAIKDSLQMFITFLIYVITY